MIGFRVATGAKRAGGCGVIRAPSPALSSLSVFIVVALFAPLLAPYSPTEQNLALLVDGCCPGPSLEHPMGVDELGRDELSRVIYGARYSLLIGVVSVLVGLSIGMVLGAVAGGSAELRIRR